ncbi:hypothetical protein BBBOND_0312770 [Babesia bigemina]|uniref:Ribosome-binding protein 1 n=1 Tax=Babesia bigemina TaxID=5866 RepID=A0A061DDG3_BABBI|nr:hypothetical protein BBBOND_0312770 [Babesia bigemina]CDR97374.1 hypothetical protein BBBOND_0312770 [Babesia bigemina]|eukprot:XP_012769560.1 hypothetical protein BBBOND_0312770 [Babesia bigemina]
MSRHGVSLETLKDCFRFLLGLRKDKRVEEAARALHGRIKGNYKDSQHMGHQIVPELSAFLQNVLEFYQKLTSWDAAKNKTLNLGIISPDDIVNALVECIPKFLAAMYYLWYNVDYAFDRVGGAKWRDDYKGVDTWRWDWKGVRWRYGGGLQKYLTAQTGNHTYDVIPGGFATGESDLAYDNGYSQGQDMTTDLRKILIKNGNNIFRDILVILMLSTKSKVEIQNTGNAVALLRTFCHIVADAGTKEEALIKNAVTPVGKCIEWSKLKRQCRWLKKEIQNFFKKEAFSHTGHSLDIEKLNHAEFAKTTANWLRKHLLDVRENLGKINRVDYTSDMISHRFFATKYVFPYGFIFGDTGYGTMSTEYKSLKPIWGQIIAVLSRGDVSGHLIKIKSILEGRECKDVRTKNKSSKIKKPKIIKNTSSAGPVIPTTKFTKPDFTVDNNKIAVRTPNQGKKSEDDEDEDDRESESGDLAAVPPKPEEPPDEVPESPKEVVPKKKVASEPKSTEPLATKTEVTKTEAAKPVVTKAEAAKPTATKTEATKTEAGKPAATKTEATKTEAAKPQAKNAGGSTDQNTSQSGAKPGTTSVGTSSSPHPGGTGAPGPQRNDGPKGPPGTGATKSSPPKDTVQKQQSPSPPQPAQPPPATPPGPPARPGSGVKPGGGSKGPNGGGGESQKPATSPSPAHPQAPGVPPPGPSSSGASGSSHGTGSPGYAGPTGVKGRGAPGGGSQGQQPAVSPQNVTTQPSSGTSLGPGSPVASVHDGGAVSSPDAGEPGGKGQVAQSGVDKGTQPGASSQNGITQLPTAKSPEPQSPGVSVPGDAGQPDAKGQGANGGGAQASQTVAAPNAVATQPSSVQSERSGTPGASASGSGRGHGGEAGSSRADQGSGLESKSGAGDSATTSAGKDSGSGSGVDGRDVEPSNSKDQTTASVDSKRCAKNFIDIGGGSKICVLDPKKSNPPMRYLDPQNKTPSDPNFDDVWEKGYKKSLNQDIDKNIRTNRRKQNLRSRTTATLSSQPIHTAPRPTSQTTVEHPGNGRNYYEPGGERPVQGVGSAYRNATAETPLGFIDGTVIPNDSDIKIKRLKDRIKLFNSAYNNSYALQKRKEKEEDEQLKKEFEQKEKEAKERWEKARNEEGKRAKKYDDDVNRIEKVLEQGKIQSAQKKLEEQRRIEAERKYQAEMEQYKRRLQQQRIDFANTFVGDVIANTPDSPSYQYDERLFPLVDGNTIPYKFQVNEQQMESSKLYANQLAAKRLVRAKYEQENENVNEAIQAAEEEKKKDEEKYALDQFKGRKDFLKDLWRVENFQVSQPQADEPPETVDFDDIIIHPRVFTTPPLETHDPIRLSNYMLEPLPSNVLLEISRSRHGDSTFKPANLSFEFQKNDALSSPRFAPIPSNISLHIATPPKDENVENSIQDAYGAGISKSLFIDIPKSTLQNDTYDLDIHDPPPPPNLQPLDPIGPPTPAINLTIPPLLDPQIPPPEDFDKNAIKRPDIGLCLAPWTTHTPTHGSTDIPETELLPAEAPRTVREMLTWLAGIKHEKHHKTLEQCISKAFGGSQSDPSQLALSINHTNIRPKDVFDILQLTAMFADSVLSAIAPRWRANVSSRFVKPKSSDQSDEPDCCALLCQLRDYVYACHYQLEFLKSQCSRDKLSGGWENYEYGSDAKVQSPLQSFLTDGWDSDFETHPFDPCNLCRKSRVRMGFRKDDLPEISQQGSVISSILTPSCGGSDPLLTLASYLNCLTRRTPRTTGELVSYFHNLGNSLHDMYLDTLSPLGTALAKSHADCPDWDYLGRHDLQAVKAIRGSEILTTIHNSKHDHADTLSTLVGCSSDSSNCHPHCSPITYRAYALYSQSFAHTYLSWAVYLPDRLWESVEQLLHELKQYDHTKCESLHLCSTALPLLYSHGFTPPEGKSQPTLTCQQVIDRVQEIVNGKPIARLMTCMDNFLYRVREPFIYTLVTLWSTAFFFIANTMLYRLDVLRIRSHFTRSRGSHVIDVKALLTDGTKMPSLYDIDYFDEDPIGQLVIQ